MIALVEKSNFKYEEAILINYREGNIREFDRLLNRREWSWHRIRGIKKLPTY